MLFITFSPAIQGEFISYDDTSFVLNGIKGFWNIVFGSIEVTGTYAPLTLLSYKLEEVLVQGDNEWLYHLDNILLHLGTTLFLYIFIIQLGFKRSVASLAALLFCIHSMRVESVAWVTERKDVLFSMFYLASLVSYLQYIKLKKNAWYIFSLFLGGLSVLSKSMALSLPFALGIIDWFVGRFSSGDEDKRRIILEKIPFMLGLWPVAFVTFAYITINDGLPQYGWDNILVFMHHFVFYLHTFLFPIDLVVCVQRDSVVDLFQYEYFLSLLATIMIGVSVYVFRHRCRKLWTFAFLWYVSTIFFVLKLNFGFYTESEPVRFMYIPCIGFCLFIADYLARIKFRRVIIPSIIIVLIVNTRSFTIPK